MTDESWAAAGGQPASRRQLLREPGLPILLLASVAMVLRQYLPDLLLVLGAALLIVLDAPRWGLRTASAQPPAAEENRGRVAGLAAVVAVVMTLLPRESHRLDLAFTLVGLAALWLVWLPGREEATHDGREPAAPPRWWVWPLLGVAGALVELFSFLHDTSPRVDDPGHPTLSYLVEPGLDSWPVRGLVLWLWLLAGWWLWRRVRTWGS